VVEKTGRVSNLQPGARQVSAASAKAKDETFHPRPGTTAPNLSRCLACSRFPQCAPRKGSGHSFVAHRPCEDRGLRDPSGKIGSSSPRKPRAPAARGQRITSARGANRARESSRLAGIAQVEHARAERRCNHETCVIGSRSRSRACIAEAERGSRYGTYRPHCSAVPRQVTQTPLPAAAETSVLRHTLALDRSARSLRLHALRSRARVHQNNRPTSLRSTLMVFDGALRGRAHTSTNTDDSRTRATTRSYFACRLSCAAVDCHAQQQTRCHWEG
jgi:hypothetical protein